MEILKLSTDWSINNTLTDLGLEPDIEEGFIYVVKHNIAAFNLSSSGMTTIRLNDGIDYLIKVPFDEFLKMMK